MSEQTVPPDAAAQAAAAEAVFRAIIQTEFDALAVNYVTIASCALVAYDILLTFPEEYEFIWRAKFTKGTLLYIVLRYGNFVQMVALNTPFYVWAGASDSTCRTLFYTDIWTTLVCIIPMTLVLTFRTYATCDRHPKAKWFLGVVFAVSILGLIVEDISETIQGDAIPPPLPGLSCVYRITGVPKAGAILQYASTAFFDAIIFSVTVIRLYQLFVVGKARLVRVILRDSLWYFLVLFGESVSALLMLILLPPERAALQSLLGNNARALSVIIASRIILNLRQVAGARELTLETLTTLRSSSNTQQSSDTEELAKLSPGPVNRLPGMVFASVGENTEYVELNEISRV